MGMSQNEAILKHMKSTGGITPKEAEKWFGCMRLAARIGELRARGYNIKTEMKRTENGSAYALYTLVK